MYNPANGHWYQAVRVVGAINWHGARAAAQSLSYAGYRGYLATVTSAEENAFIVTAVLSQLQPLNNWWLGGFQDRSAFDYREPTGGWRWETGEPWVYAGWSSWEPNNAGGVEDGIELRNDGTWNDVTFSGLGGYIVEYGPPASPGQILLQLSSPVVVGGTAVSAQVTLPFSAPASGALLEFGSSHPAIAAVSAPYRVTVPPGGTSISVPVVTSPVAVASTVELSVAWLGSGTGAVARLQVLPSSDPLLSGGPQILSVRLISPIQVELAWLDVSADETAFEIQRRNLTGDWTWIALVAANTTRFTDHTVVPGATYLYRVRAQSARGVSAWSAETSVTTLAGP